MCPNCTCEDCKPTPEAVARLKEEIAALKAQIDTLRGYDRATIWRQVQGSGGRTYLTTNHGVYSHPKGGA